MALLHNIITAIKMLWLANLSNLHMLKLNNLVFLYVSLY